MDEALVLRILTKLAIKDGRDLFDVLTLVISGISLLIGASGVIVTLWLAISVQSGFNNRRILKDHFIREVLEIRSDYLDLLRKLQSGEVPAKDVTYYFQQINIRVEALMPLLQAQFALDASIRDYHLDLLSGATELAEYAGKFKRNLKVFKSRESRESLQASHARSVKIFTELIVQINDAK